MAGMHKKLAEKGGQMIVKIQKNEREIDAPKEVLRAIKDFCELKKKIDELAKYKEVIVTFAKTILEGSENSTVTLISGNDSVKVTFGWDVKVGDVEKLKRVLGDRFELFVREVVEYRPEAKLKEMALVDDDLKECLQIKEKAPSVVVL